MLYLIWRDPWMAVAPDTYIARTLALRRLAHATRRRRRRATRRSTSSASPGGVDRVLLSSEPYHFKERHIAEVARRSCRVLRCP